MTFAELFIFLAVAAGLYFLLRPLQRRLESYLRRIFKTKSRSDTVIDITDYSKKDKKP